jgi:hypothetical protein
VDVSDRRAKDRLNCQVPKGNWKVMAFYLSEGKARIVDYLDETAMNAFVSMTYEKYRENFGSYFGNHCCPRRDRPVARPAENMCVGRTPVGYLG